MGLAFLGPMRLTTGKATLGRLPSQGYGKDSRQKHILSLSEKEAYFQELTLRASLLVWHTSTGLWRCSQETVKTNKFSKVKRLQNHYKKFVVFLYTIMNYQKEKKHI